MNTITQVVAKTQSCNPDVLLLKPVYLIRNTVYFNKQTMIECSGKEGLTGLLKLWYFHSLHAITKTNNFFAIHLSIYKN